MVIKRPDLTLRNKLNTGRKLSPEHRKKLSLAHKGRFQGTESWHWCGENINYSSLHSLVTASDVAENVTMVD